MARYYTETTSAWPVSIPQGPYNGHTTCVPAELLPLIIGSLNSVAILQRYKASNDEYAALSALRGAQYMLVKNCNQAAEQLYRLIDTTFNGTVYTVEEVKGEVIISPSIPEVPSVPTVPVIQALYDTRGYVGQAIAGLPVDTPLTQSPTIHELLTTIAEQAGGWTDEEKIQVITKLIEIAASDAAILAAV